jgi:hypothetical protein
MRAARLGPLVNLLTYDRRHTLAFNRLYRLTDFFVGWILVAEIVTAYFCMVVLKRI